MDQPINLLVFALGKERYGVDMTHVVEVLPPGSMTAVPCTPPWLLGITSYRGRALSLVDLGALLDVAEKAVAFGDPAVVVQVEGMLFGFQADEAPAVVQVDASRWAPIAPTAGVPQAGFVRALTEERIGVLDLGALASSGQMLVNEGS